MASVTLDRVWLNLASDPSQSVAAWSGSPTDDDTLPGQVYTYANGRRRVITTAGDVRQLKRTLRVLDAATIETLREWRGQVVLFRDKRGRKVYVTYFTVSTTDYPDGSGYDVTLSMESVTFQEDV